ncbi:S1 family peptidase [Nocardiopsis chromatogenes]|uniref:S1 family peptidase n=1 Tax=Nocardiopsis chromatogenes TaxID=280239 RepID=UPI00034734A3|nr:S1 family peptidase [Nocardiopsis chromatogenes]
MERSPHARRAAAVGAAALAAVFAAALLAAPAPAAADGAATGQVQQAQIVAGDPFINTSAPHSRCTIGAVVTVGFLAASTCGSAGDRISGRDGGTGTVAWSSKESGVLLVEADDNWRPTPYINTHGGGRAVVRGTTEAPVGAGVCRTGSTTGWHCGIIQAKNQTIRTPDGTVYNVTRTNVCAEPGDQGGAFYSGGHLQGLTLGGSGNCASGGTTFFLPIGPILARYALTPVTG